MIEPYKLIEGGASHFRRIDADRPATGSQHIEVARISQRNRSTHGGPLWVDPSLGVHDEHFRSAHGPTHAPQRAAPGAVGTRVSSRAPRPDPYVRLSRIRLLPRVCDGTSCRIRSSACDTRAWF